MQAQEIQRHTALLLKSTSDVIFHLSWGKWSQKRDRKHHSEGKQLSPINTPHTESYFFRDRASSPL